jgi:hypothetical protein
MVDERMLIVRTAVITAAIACVVSCESDRNGDVIAPLFFATEVSSEAIREQHSEPNDTLATAIPIATNNLPLPSAFHRVGDIDYFVFTAAHDAAYIIQTQGLDQGVQTRIDVLENTGEQIDTDTGGGLEEGAAMLAWSPSVGGIYYVRVTLIGDDIGMYQLKISVEEDGYEPDGSIATAKDVLPIDGSLHQHTLHEMSDEDHIAFRALAGFGYRAEVVSSVYSPQFMQPVHISIVDSLGNVPVTNQPDFPSFVETVADFDGTHYVRVSPNSEEALGTYSVGVTVGDDPYEPDNSIAQADTVGPISNGEVQRRSISPDDEDYISFEILDDYMYTFYTRDVSAGLMLRASIHHENGTSLLESDIEIENPILRWKATIPDSAPHTYYLRIVGTSDIPGTYSIGMIQQQPN